MDEFNGYETDEELEQALYTALVREPAPDNLLLRVEEQLFAAHRAPAVPGLRLLTVSTWSVWSSLWSVAAHAAVFVLIVLLPLVVKKERVQKPTEQLTDLDARAFLPGKQPAGGGGGGGSHNILPLPKGKLPKFEQQPVVPPILALNEHPKLTAEPAIVMPKDLELPPDHMPNIGDPRTSVAGPASNGSGELAGMGTGSGGGIGPGRGNGYGPGEGGGYGGSVYQVGGGVAAPKVIYAVDPEFSDEARRAKFQGMCVVALIVDAQGNPQRVHAVGHLGMGLDEKAVAAVKQYKFKPATLQGRPVPVEVNVEVDFRIY
jgi:periplasmic protein TonB